MIRISKNVVCTTWMVKVIRDLSNIEVHEALKSLTMALQEFALLTSVFYVFALHPQFRLFFSTLPPDFGARLRPYAAHLFHC